MAVAATAFLFVTGAVAVSGHAQDTPDRPRLDDHSDTPGGIVDTSVTPGPSSKSEWKQVAGAEFPSSELVEGSVTSFDTDFYAVSMRNTKLGFAGGAKCAVETPPQEIETCDQTTGNPARGARVPVMYRFRQLTSGDRVWEPIDLGEGSDEPGYVGAIAWIDTDTAVAVGGTGTYPRREPDCVTGTPACIDPAGEGRAWMYEADEKDPEDGRWRELDLSGQRAQGMGGLTALAFNPGWDPEWGIEGAAGGLAQIWEWKGGRFTRRVDRHSADRVRNRHLFRYRVRQIKPHQTGFVAVTAGCCGPTRAHNVPRALRFERPGLDPVPGINNLGDRNPTVEGLWVVDVGELDALEPSRRRDNLGKLCERQLWVTEVRDAACPTFETTASGLPGREHDETLETARAVTPNPKAATPLRGDSYHAVMSSGSADVVVVTPGGVETDGERPSEIVRQNSATLQAPTVVVPSLSTARLVDADGDGPPQDQFPDWAVGEQRAARSSLGRRGLFVATNASVPLQPDTVTPPPASGDGIDSYEPTDEKRIRRYLSANHQQSESYSLNAIDMVELGGSPTGQGWAVGDRGAIVGLGETGGGAGVQEPPPPELGDRGLARLPDDAAYAGLTGDPPPPGLVPPLASRPERIDGGWRVRPVGRLKAATRIVMSRSGDEGWALQGDDPIHGISHFDGRRWNVCPRDVTPPPGLPKPDPACENAVDLLGPTFGEARAGDGHYRPFPAARVPFEADDDPSNDDEFEVVAISAGSGGKGIVRYRDGRWRSESGLPPDTQTGTAVAFSRPDDGWVLADRPGNIKGENNYRFFHFDGERWVDCRLVGSGPIATYNDECDPEDRLPQRPAEGDVTDLVGVPGRVYAIGFRRQHVELPAQVLTLTERSYNVGQMRQPMLLFREPGRPWAKEVQQGEYDPGYELDGQVTGATDNGQIESLAIVRRPDGRYEGWAAGVFGMSLAKASFGSPSGNTPRRGSVELDDLLGARPAASPLLRLDPGAREWRLPSVAESGVMREYGHWFDGRSYWGTRDSADSFSSQIAIEPAAGESSPAFMTQDTGRLFSWNRDRRRWELLSTNRPLSERMAGYAEPAGFGSALSGDGRGGFFTLASDHMFHYTDREPQPVFEEVARPDAQPGWRITALAAEPDGTLWAATNSDLVYRYRRATGWDRVAIPGWEPGRVVTNPAAASAIAFGESGVGLVVGEDGRIAELSPGGVRLDPAAGTRCDPGAPVEPCGTSRDLLAVAVAPDGSAITGGRRMSLLWRPASGGFSAVNRPGASGTSITGASMPVPGRAWLATDAGLVFVGEMREPGVWSWDIENLTPKGDVISAGALSAVTVRADGHGYALGANRMLVRTPDGTWSPVELKAHSVAIPAGGGGGAVLGQESGAIRTLVDGRFETAREADYFLAAGTGRVSALALAPGLGEGDLEAWAVVDSRPAQRILHYASDPDEPLLRPDARVRALPDAPAPRPGELSAAVFGKSDCHSRICVEMVGTTEYAEAVLNRVVDEVARRSKEPGGPRIVLSTGDSTDVAGYAGSQVTESAIDTAGEIPQEWFDLDGGYGPEKLRRWGEFVADRLEDEGLAVFGAPGVGDLSDPFPCNGASCDSLRRSAKSGENLAWRQTMARRAAPWGAGAATGAGLRFEPVSDGPRSVRGEDVEVADPADGGVPRNAAEVPLGGASTHYAFDVVRADGDPGARVVVLDSSFGTLAGSDPLQQPAEPDGGQLAWLERVLCTEGSVADEPCTRAPEQPAVVVSNTPTYSYVPGLGLQAAADGGVVESILLRHRASVMVSGRLGWNGLYWATAPGLHYPCTGQRYTQEPPERPGTCAPSGASEPAGEISEGMDQLSAALGPMGSPPSAEDVPVRGTPLEEATGEGFLPVAVASGAGGKFGIPGTTQARDGFWHGFSIVRVAADGDPSKTVVEQRPIYDHVAIEAQERSLKPGQRMTLRGFGRGPLATNGPAPAPAQFDRIDSDAITHRYDLVRADPENPWLPLEDANGDYVRVDPRVATVDQETGLVRAGRGLGERTYAIGILSVGELAASYPLVFEPRRSFTAQRAKVTLPSAPRAARAPPAQPPIRVADAQPPPPPAAPPAAGSPLSAQTLQPPQAPALPNLAGLQPLATPQASVPPHIPAPSAPPVPPSLPPTQQAQPLALGAKLQAVAIVPSVNPPAPPPVNPAPPAGSAARKEAKQRQAAVAKSEEGSQDGAAEDTQSRVNSMSDPSDASMRLSADNHYAFTRVATPEQASAWSRAALYGGSLGLAGIALALGFSIMRPRPRRTPPEVPAPAQCNAWRPRG